MSEKMGYLLQLFKAENLLLDLSVRPYLRRIRVDIARYDLKENLRCSILCMIMCDE